MKILHKSKFAEKPVKIVIIKVSPAKKEKKLTFHLVTSLILFIGCLSYVIGLFVPFYAGDPGPVPGLYALSFGKIYLPLMAFAGTMSIVGIFTKKKYYRIFLPNTILCTIEPIFHHLNISSMHPVLTIILRQSVRAGFFLTLFGGLFAIIGAFFLSPFAED